MKTTKELTHKFQLHHTAIQDRNGVKSTLPQDGSKRLSEYCEELLIDHEEMCSFKVEVKEPPPTLSEMLHAMQRMSLSKAAVPDNISIELLRYCMQETWPCKNYIKFA